MDRLQTLYKQSIRQDLGKELAIGNLHAVPRVTKMMINVGLNLSRTDAKKITQIERVIATIAGQKPSLRRARKAISSFKLRAGDPVALSLTLRGQRMYDFLERLVRVVLPRVRDFRGIPRKSFDGRGNLSIGLREMSVFPEIKYEDIDILHGIEITIVTTATSDDQGAKLLRALGMPLVG